MKKKLASIAMLIVVAVLAVISFFVLPDTVVTQFSISSSRVTTMPKLSAIAFPALIGIVGTVVQLSEKENKHKGIIVSAAAILVLVIMLCVNL